MSHFMGVDIFRIGLNWTDLGSWRLTLNEFFLSICMLHPDKNVPRKWSFGGIFWYCVLQDRWSFRGLRPLNPHQGPGQLLQAMIYSHCSAGYRLNHPCPHDNFGPPLKIPLKKGLQQSVLCSKHEQQL